MKSWLGWAVRLYPKRWRERYGEELAALVEDARPGWRGVLDLIMGALMMQLRHGPGFLKVAVALSLAGALLAAGIASIAAPGRYVSSAVLDFTRPQDAGDAFGQHQVEGLRDEILSRTRLAILIQKNDLYSSERGTMPMDEVVERMRRDIQIHPIGKGELEVTFAYHDPVQARTVAQALAGQFLEANRRMNSNRAHAWTGFNQDFFHANPREAYPLLANANAPREEAMQITDSPGTPARVGSFPFLAVLAGLVLGVIGAAAVRWPGAVLRVAALSAAAAVLAFGLSLLWPDRYTSTAVLTIVPALVPERLSGVSPEPLADRINAMERQILSDEWLARLLQDPTLDLYPGDRSRPLALRAARMRRDIRMERATTGAFEVSFTYSDRYRAQAVVHRMVSGFGGAFIDDLRAKEKSGNAVLQEMAHHNIGETLQLLDPANVPVSPVGPNRWLFAALGALIGLLAETTQQWKAPAPLPKLRIRPRSIPLGPALRFLKVAAALAAACALAALAVSLAMPRQYTLTATLEVTPGKGDTNEFAQAYGDQIKAQILMHGRLAALIQRTDLDLYATDRLTVPLEDAVQQMRNRDLRIENTGGNTWRISFTYDDRAKARKVTEALAQAFAAERPQAAEQRAAAWHEILPHTEPPAAPAVAVLREAAPPEASINPSRGDLATWGLLAGLFAALAWQWPRRMLVASVAAIAAGAAAFGLSYVISESYTSTATVRLEAGMVPEGIAGAAMLSPQDQFERMRRDLLSEGQLRYFVSNPGMNLFRGEKRSHPLEELIPRLRQAIQIEPSSDYRTVKLSFTYGEADVAKKVVDQMVARAMEMHVMWAKQAAHDNAALTAIQDHQVGERLEVIDPASAPEDPVGPNRWLFAAIGGVAGLAAGLCIRRRPGAPALVPAHAI